jgi:SAM-dependent methyltransferase
MVTDVLLAAAERDGRQPVGRSCRFCGSALERTVVDLGMSPLCENFLRGDQLDDGEVFYPLCVRACESCGLTQLPAYVPREEIFTSAYAYHSAYSRSWVAHAKAYVDRMVPWLGLDAGSLVVEVASNDGYLLQHFLPHGVPVLGVDPAREVVEVAESRGVPTVNEFLGETVAHEIVHAHGRADLVVANNVLAHVPDVKDFVAGISVLLAPGGTATFEFPHVLRLLEGVQYDTIYHEHFSYLSLAVVDRILAGAGLQVVDVEELPTHGGSLRVYARHAPADSSDAVAALLLHELSQGIDDPATHARFAAAVRKSKASLLELLIGAHRQGRRVIGYGAPGKGNTLLNYCGIRSDLIECLVDLNPHKHGMFTPGTHIPIHPVELIDEIRPDLIIVMPWNLVGEISGQLAHTSDWGAKLVVAIPQTMVFEPGSAPRVELAAA